MVTQLDHILKPLGVASGIFVLLFFARWIIGRLLSRYKLGFEAVNVRAIRLHTLFLVFFSACNW